VGVEVNSFVVDDFVKVGVVFVGFVINAVVAVEVDAVVGVAVEVVVIVESVCVVCDVVVDDFVVGWVVGILCSDVKLKGQTFTQKSISVSECSFFPHSFKQLSTSFNHPSPQQIARFLSVFLVFPGQLSGHFAQSQASQLLKSHKLIVSLVASKTQGFKEIPH